MPETRGPFITGIPPGSCTKVRCALCKHLYWPDRKLPARCFPRGELVKSPFTTACRGWERSTDDSARRE